MLGIIYRYGPSTITKWNLFSPGSWISTLLFWITSSGFSYYVSNFSTYNKLYGSLGTLLIIMLWLYLNSFVILVGFELNVVIYGNSRKQNVIAD
jgi:membrane protein